MDLKKLHIIRRIINWFTPAGSASNLKEMAIERGRKKKEKEEKEKRITELEEL